MSTPKSKSVTGHHIRERVGRHFKKFFSHDKTPSRSVSPSPSPSMMIQTAENPSRPPSLLNRPFSFRNHSSASVPVQTHHHTSPLRDRDDDMFVHQNSNFSSPAVHLGTGKHTAPVSNYPTPCPSPVPVQRDNFGFSDVIDDTDAQFHLTVEDIDGTFRNLEGAVQTELDIQNLYESVKSIRDAFKTIGSQLLTFDLRVAPPGFPSLPQGHRSMITPLAPQWKILHQRFEAGLRMSQDNASRALALLQHYRDVILGGFLQNQDRAVASDGLQAEICNIKPHVKENADSAATMDVYFRKLCDDIDDFWIVITTSIPKAQDAMKRDLERMREELKKLNDDFLKFNQAPRSKLTSALQKIGFEFKGFLSMVIELNPATCAFLDKAEDTSRVKGNVPNSEIIDLELRKKRIGADLDSYTSKESDIGAIAVELLAQTDLYNSTTARIAIIGDIWQSFHVDLVQMEQWAKLYYDEHGRLTGAVDNSETMDRKVQMIQRATSIVLKQLELFTRQLNRMKR